MGLVTANINYLKDLNCVIHYPGLSSENFIIESPNGEGTFSYVIRPVGNSLYRDGANNHRRGSREHRVILRFDYKTHRMDLNKILASEYIVFDFGDIVLPFLNNEFKFNKDSVTKNWFESMPISAGNLPKAEANPFPSGSFSAEYISIRTWMPND